MILRVNTVTLQRQTVITPHIFCSIIVNDFYRAVSEIADKITYPQAIRNAGCRGGKGLLRLCKKRWSRSASAYAQSDLGLRSWSALQIVFFFISLFILKEPNDEIWISQLLLAVAIFIIFFFFFYCILYLKYSDSQTSYHTWPKYWKKKKKKKIEHIILPVDVSKTAGWVTKSVYRIRRRRMRRLIWYTLFALACLLA